MNQESYSFRDKGGIPPAGLEQILQIGHCYVTIGGSHITHIGYHTLCIYSLNYFVKL